MKDQVNRVEYFALTVDDRAGEGAQLGNRLAKEGVNLLALLAFPAGAGKTQVDLVPEHPEALIKAAKKLNLSIGSPKACFYIQGTDRPGAMAEIVGRLGDAHINVRASLGACAGGNRYGALLWVAPSAGRHDHVGASRLALEERPSRRAPAGRASITDGAKWPGRDLVPARHRA